MNLESTVIHASNGVAIPQLGFGVYKITKEEQFRTAISEAIRIGYRHFDTASPEAGCSLLGYVFHPIRITGLS
ncbi:2,5-diketo-D-gluconic acid reductase A [compost metagenome]